MNVSQFGEKKCHLLEQCEWYTLIVEVWSCSDHPHLGIPQKGETGNGAKYESDQNFNHLFLKSARFCKML